MTTSGSGASTGRRRHRVLPASAALMVFLASTLVGLLAATSASAASTELYSWGYNPYGGIGNGTTVNASTPVEVNLPSGVTATGAAAGTGFGLVIGSNGKLYSYGYGADGELGDGSTANSTSAQVVSLPAGITATAVSAGATHGVALGSNGAVYDWGDNSDGQLGNNSTTSSDVPVKADLPAGTVAVAVAAGQYMTEALTSGGDVYAWGDGAMGALGDGKDVNETVPTEATVSGVTAIAAGGYHSLIISGGDVYAFGYGGFGQLGNGALTNAATRVKTSLPSGVTAVAIAAGLYHSMAIGNNGVLYAWGDDGNGQLGDGNTADEKTPVTVSMPAGVKATAISAESSTSLAIGSDGNLYGWGYNGLDEIGNGTTTDAHTPVQVSLSPVAKPPTSVAAGSSADSAFAIGAPTPAPTTTTLAVSPTSATYGQTVTITATISRSDGGGSVSFSNGSTISGCNAVPLTLVSGSYQAVCSTSFAAGSYALSATYTGDTLYATSTSAATNLTVSPAPLVVTASSASSTYGSAPGAVTASYSGFVNGDNASSLTTAPTCSTTASASSPAGSYPTSCSGAADPNYSITYQNGTVTVGPAPLAVTASSATMTYGGAVPGIIATYNGFVNGDSSASLTTQPTCSTTALSSSAVGSYASSCSGAADPNYTISYVNGVVQIGPSPLVVTASSGSMTYGSAPPSIAPSYTGFVNGDTATSLTTAPSCTTTATSASPVGTYDTSCSGAVDPNYAITYADGSVNVNPAPLTVTASSGMSGYGSTPPTVTPTVTGLQNGETVSVLGAGLTCSSAATASSPVGTYATSCSGASDANYAITYVNGTTTVIPAPLTITASSGTMTYGGTVPVVTATVTGLQNGDNTSVLAGLTCTTAAAATQPVGTYATSCSGAVDANYAISYVDGSITIDPAPLTITASSASTTYGGTVPPLSPIVSGLQNGEDVTVLGAGLLCTVGADSTSPAGTYATSCAGAIDNNYEITYAFGTLTITPAPLMITASSETAAYGTAPDAITASYSGFVNGDSASSLSTPPTCTTTATSSSPVGSYPTSCSGAA
ncbi:MAG TPA: MBG domain-containing protein, partial [Acidimicrobiales bacterium]|nr:MBG domain-containing protein [Acidimicrobiales bacterium]